MTLFTDYRNIYEMLQDTASQRGSAPAYRWFADDGSMETVSWETCRREVRQAAKSLMAMGVGRGDKISILSYSCYRWVLCDLAATAVGAVTVGIYQTLPAGDCRYIIDHSDSVLVFAEDVVQLGKLRQVLDDLPKVKHIVLFNGEDPDEEMVLEFSSFLGMGGGLQDEVLDDRIAGVQPGDVAGIVYTSGTTGVPKGAMLTHDNITFTAQSVGQSVVWKPDDHVFLFLPLAHVFARTCVYTTLLSGCTMTFNRNMNTLAEDLKAARPNWFPSVPRIYEKVQAKVVATAEAKGGLALRIFRWAFRVGSRVSDLKVEKAPIPVWLSLQCRLATMLVFGKIQKALGGRVRWCIAGAAPLNPETGRFFHAAGVLIVEGIGMTENTSFSNLNRYDDYRFGWVGPPGPGIEQKIAEDGEILFRGRNVMKGYYKMPEETAATITEDGWLKTGDLGHIDEKNFLKITGRKKEIIVTSGGKNIAPARIEGVLSTSRFINQVCVVGDRRNYLAALVTLEMDAVCDAATKQGIAYRQPDDLLSHPKIVEMVVADVERKNCTLASFETVKKISIVPEFTIENGLLTPTLKVRKNEVASRFREEIEGLFTDAG